MIDMEKSVTIKVTEAAAILGISRITAYKLAKQGKLPGLRKLGSHYLVSKQALQDWIDGKVE